MEIESKLKMTISNISGPAFFPIKKAGLLLLHGSSKREYLQRQTSNNLDLLKNGIVVPNILPNSKGRVLDIFINMLWGDGIALITPSERANGLRSYFEQRIFFNDDVRFTDESDEWAQFIIFDHENENKFASLLAIDQVPSPNEVINIIINKKEAFLLGLNKQGKFNSYLLIVASNESEKTQNWLAATGLKPISDLEYEQFRIENGIAGVNEFSAAYTPFELGLNDYVSSSKGCYTGQEVLARQVNFDKISKIKVFIQSKHELVRDAKIIINDQLVGEISSALNFEAKNGIALAVIKKNKAIPWQKIQISLESEKFSGEIVKVFD